MAVSSVIDSGSSLKITDTGVVYYVEKHSIISISETNGNTIIRYLNTAISIPVSVITSAVAQGYINSTALGTVIIQGTNDAGTASDIPVTSEGHIETAIHDPLLPFGSVHTESLTPIFQTDAVYGLNSGQVASGATLSGSATVSDSNFVISSGVTIYAQAFIQGRKRLRYRAGQGVVGRCTALFTAGVASSYQVVGFGHAEDGLYFGYVGTAFGILYVQRGVREVQTLTITVASSTTENITVTLNSVAISVAVTNSANIQRTVWEISQGTYAGWKAYPIGATIVFVADASGNKAGTFSITATTAAGTFAETKAGVASTDAFIAQSSWNGVDILDGNGASGITLDPTKGNVYQFDIQYLGYGAIVCKVEVVPTNGNNKYWQSVHTIKAPNTLTTTTFGNPSFPFSMAVYSAGSTTNLTTKTGSFAGFIEGQKMLHGNRFSYLNQLTTVGSSNYHALFSIMNTRYYAGRTNQAVINIMSVSGAIKHTSPVIYYLIKNAALLGNPNFASYATNSCSAYDTTATTCTFATNDQLIWSGHLGDTGEIDHTFSEGNLEEVTLQPGEWVTLAAKSTTGTPAYVTGSINTREDQ